MYPPNYTSVSSAENIELVKSNQVWLKVFKSNRLKTDHKKIKIGGTQNFTGLKTKSAILSGKVNFKASKIPNFRGTMK